MPGLVVDGLPESLTRAFDVRAYRDAFLLEGHVHLKRLNDYRNIDGARRDEGEGESYALIPGDVPSVTIDRATREITRRSSAPGLFHRRSSFLNLTYSYSLSKPSIDSQRQAKDFGPFLVHISDPQSFVDRLFAAASAQLDVAPRALSYCEAFPVSYTKGHVLNGEPAILDAVRLDYGQKPDRYAWELEYRIVLVFDGALHSFPGPLDLRLGSLGDIASAS